MENYNNSANVGIDITIKFFKDRMKELKISQVRLAELIDINESTLIRNFKKETEMSLSTYLKICGALKLRPYLIPAEIDETEFQRMFFN